MLYNNSHPGWIPPDDKTVYNISSKDWVFDDKRSVNSSHSMAEPQDHLSKDRLGADDRPMQTDADSTLPDSGIPFSASWSVYHTVLYTIVSLSLLGNGLLILTIASHRHLRSSTNAFIVSLAVADFLFAFPALPLHITVEQAEGPVLGQSLPSACLIVMSMISFQIVITLASLFALTVERYVCFLYPLKHRRWTQRGTVAAIITCMWMYSLFIGSLPLLGWNSLRYYNPWAEYNQTNTSTEYPASRFMHCSFIAVNTGPYIGMLCLVHIFPVCILMPIFYVRMFITIRRFLARKSFHNGYYGYRSALLKDDSVQRLQQNAQQSIHAIRLSNRRSLRLLIVIGVYGVFSWLPVILWYCVATKGFTRLYMTADMIDKISLPMAYYQITSSLGVVNCAINPYMYGLGNIPIRRAFINMISRRLCCNQSCQESRILSNGSNPMELNSRTFQTSTPPKWPIAHSWNGEGARSSYRTRSNTM